MRKTSIGGVFFVGATVVEVLMLDLGWNFGGRLKRGGIVLGDGIMESIDATWLSRAWKASRIGTDAVGSQCFFTY